MRTLKRFLKSTLPPSLIDRYHLWTAYLAAAVFRNPSRKLLLIGVTGTKGKSSTVEMINAILEEAGYTTALVNSIRFKVGADSLANTTRMSMPGRFFIQRFLAEAYKRGCNAAVIEMTSEGSRQHRHRCLELDALVFTNLAPEHIESHGSFQKYADAKYEIGLQLARSLKRPRTIVANKDDPQGARYLGLDVENKLPFSLSQAGPYSSTEHGGQFRFDDTDISLPQPGDFSLKNALAAAVLTRALKVPTPTIARALGKLDRIPGRAERIESGQSFDVVVDYAHTPDSLEALYTAYKAKRKICVLGSTGGGRDTWKRPEMGRIADQHCETVILTNEDPYDEDPRHIVDDLARGMSREPEVIMDRRAAIRRALSLAHNSDAVLITGKGTDPHIALEKGKKMPWSDADVVREELQKIIRERAL